jgi:hypothetical protein
MREPQMNVLFQKKVYGILVVQNSGKDSLSLGREPTKRHSSLESSRYKTQYMRVHDGDRRNL